MHDLMLETERFAVHVLAKNQVRYGLHFAKRDSGDNSQFADIPHEMDPRVSNIANLRVKIDSVSSRICQF